MITTRKDFVKIQNLYNRAEVSTVMEFAGISQDRDKLDISELEMLEVDLKIQNQKEFFDIIMSKYEKYIRAKL